MTNCYSLEMNKESKEKKLSSYTSIISLIASALGVIILCTLRYAQVSFQIEELQQSHEIISVQLKEINKSLNEADDKMDRLYNMYNMPQEKGRGM